MLRDGLTARHVSKKSPRERIHWKRIIVTMPLAFEKKENEQGEGIVYLQHSGVECHSTAEGHPRGKMASGRLWLRFPARNRSVESFPRSDVFI